MPTRLFRLALLVMAFAATGSRSDAAFIAVFGDNNIDNYLTTQGHTVTLVSDAQLATPGFLNAYTTFIYTRNGFNFGTSLSAAAAANVSAYVSTTGAVVLFNSDLADGISSEANLNQLLNNAVALTSASGNGYIGELGGAAAAFTSNGNGYTPLNLIAGVAGSLDNNGGGSGGSFTLAPAGAGSPLFSGVALPYDPGNIEFGASITGVSASQVFATYDNNPNSPSILVRLGQNAAVATPLPPTAIALIAGVPLLAGFARRRRVL